jgi:hypothetical protein
VGEHCEGCGIPRHKRESCNLKEHPDFNKEGKWLNSSSYKKKKVLNKWSEHAGGRALADAKYPSSRRERERIEEHAEQRGKPWERRRTEDSGSGGIYGVARKSAPEKGRESREVRLTCRLSRQ